MPEFVADGLFVFLLAHPFCVSVLWTIYGLIDLARPAASKRDPTTDTALDYTVIIPFYNEPEGALVSARSLAGVSPEPREILLIDDGSVRGMPDDVALPRKTRVLRLETNGGKARALNAALRAVRTELVVCLDADTQAVSQDWRVMLARFRDPTLGAVTGKIWPAQPTRLIQQFQHLDYVAVIGLIKAAETNWGALLTVSGAFVAYRRRALEAIGGWRDCTATEDIDASWRLQELGWRLGYERRWVCQAEMVPSIRGLWRQRRRWSMGMGRCGRDHLLKAARPRARQLPVAVTATFNVGWIFASLAAASALLADFLFATEGASLGWIPEAEDLSIYLLGSVVIFSAQLICAAALDGKPWTAYARLFLLGPFYPFYYWSLLFTSFLVGFPLGLMRRDRGKWRRTLRQREAALAEVRA
ncbi:glycosyltransferase [uncultured Rhodospira sp.]|uniref:glycosyltransferase family 2 protein n=1 Tax=uncultured Rhodospira sp. TaxID=1936189 RepID=UPI002624FB5A|nr:glycosyltransferase [uncultured Rhodospira sp.]